MKSGYKQTEVGVIPDDWEVKPFAELFAFRNGVNADKASYGQGIRFINVLEPITYSHIYGPEITGQVTLPESVISLYAVHRGDVLFNRTSETQEEVALGATYLGTERVVFGGFVIRGRLLDQRLDPVYSGYALRAPCIRAQIIPMGQGAIRANVGQQHLELVLAPLPPLQEQRAIAEALSDVDALLGALDRLIAKKRDLKQAAMQQLLTGQARLPGFTDNSRTKHTEVGVIPEGWDAKPLNRISPKQSVGLVINPSTYFDDAGTVPLLVGSNVSENLIDSTTANRITETSNEMLPASRLAAGDLVTVRVGEPGVTAVVPIELDGCNCASMMIVRKHPSFDSHWLCYAMNSTHGRHQVEHVQYGTAQKQFNISDAVNFQYPVPPLSEQCAIVEVLADMDAELAGLKQRRGKTHALKQGMMQELLSGKTRLI